MIPTLEQKIAKFLSEPKKSEGDGWPTVEPLELAQLADIFREIIEKKWESDADGSPAVQMIVNARTINQPMHFFPIPYPHKIETHAERLQVLALAHNNVGIAQEQVRQCILALQFEQEDR